MSKDQVSLEQLITAGNSTALKYAPAVDAKVEQLMAKCRSEAGSVVGEIVSAAISEKKEERSAKLQKIHETFDAKSTTNPELAIALYEEMKSQGLINEKSAISLKVLDDYVRRYFEATTELEKQKVLKELNRVIKKSLTEERLEKTTGFEALKSSKSVTPTTPVDCSSGTPLYVPNSFAVASNRPQLNAEEQAQRTSLYASLTEIVKNEKRLPSGEKDSLQVLLDACAEAVEKAKKVEKEEPFQGVEYARKVILEEVDKIQDLLISVGIPTPLQKSIRSVWDIQALHEHLVTLRDRGAGVVGSAAQREARGLVTSV